MLNVIRCVTKNAKSVLLTAVFAVILIYLFSICGFLFLQNDFIMEVDPNTDSNIQFFLIKNKVIIIYHKKKKLKELSPTQIEYQNKMKINNDSISTDDGIWNFLFYNYSSKIIYFINIK